MKLVAEVQKEFVTSTLCGWEREDPSDRAAHLKTCMFPMMFPKLMIVSLPARALRAAPRGSAGQ